MNSLLACALLLSFTPDVGPKPREKAPGPVAVGRDMAGIKVEMAAEEVDLVLSQAGLKVHAIFHMKNPGDDVAFETGFPIGPFKNMTGFKIREDGREVASQLVDRELKAPAVKDKGRETAPREDEAHDYWHVWDGRYQGRATTTIEVDYFVEVWRWTPQRWTGYVLHSGAPWKGPIGRAVVTLRFEGPITPDHLEGLTPRAGLTRKDDCFTWTRERFEPTPQDDIEIMFNVETTWPEEKEARKKEAPGSWSGRVAYAYHLSRAASRWGAPRLSADERGEFLDALLAAIPEGKPHEGKYLVPGCEPDFVYYGRGTKERAAASGTTCRSYAYASKKSNGFRCEAVHEGLHPFWKLCLDACRENPEQPGARKVLESCRVFLRHLVKGDVLIDLRELDQDGGIFGIAPRNGDEARAAALLADCERLMEAK